MLKVEILAHTPNPGSIIAMAGKLCYSPVGIDDLGEKLTSIKAEGFVKKLMGMGHESPLEHVTFTFGIEGISRACSHQIVRHRIASYSQQSQRYVKLDQFEYIMPPAIKDNEDLKYMFELHMKETQRLYDELVERLIATKLISEEYCEEVENIKCDLVNKGIILINEDNSLTENPAHVAIFLNEFYSKNFKLYCRIEKRAIEDARYVFPNACETKMVVTMNIRSLHHFFEERCCERAQWEIRELATEMLRQCKEVSPLLFANCGPKCVRGKCTEGKMSCGLSKEKRKLFIGEE